MTAAAQDASDFLSLAGAAAPTIRDVYFGGYIKHEPASFESENLRRAEKNRGRGAGAWMCLGGARTPAIPPPRRGFPRETGRPRPTFSPPSGRRLCLTGAPPDAAAPRLGAVDRCPGRDGLADGIEHGPRLASPRYFWLLFFIGLQRWGLCPDATCPPPPCQCFDAPPPRAVFY